MEIVKKFFSELTIDELFEIYKIRSAVFVVEQNCVYQDIDDIDKVSIHIYFKEENKIIAYLRVIPQEVLFDEVAIGRVISLKRRQGIATQLLKEGIQTAIDRFKTKQIVIEAQVYAKQLYEKIGFIQESEEFLEDGIPHVKMRYIVNKEKELD